MVNDDNPILKSMLKVFSLFMVQFESKDTEVRCVWIKCNNCNKHVHCQILTLISEDIISVFIKAVVFHHVGLSRMIQTKEQIEFVVNEKEPLM